MSQPAAVHPRWLNQPLAIIGMAVRLPGADGLDQYWRLLANGDCSIEPMSPNKLDRERYFHPEKGQRGKTYSDIGGFVKERQLDWSIMNISPQQAEQWDECHLNFCEVAAKACVDAGYDSRNVPYKNTGVFVGHSGGSTLGGELAYRVLAPEYLQLLDELEAWQQHGTPELQRKLLERLTAKRPQRQGGKPWVDAGFAAAIVTQSLGLTGPHKSIDAACASSLVAMALASVSLHSGQTDMAIVGGASYNKTDSLILFSHAQSCSATASRPFDQNADGLIGSEGYVALVLKTLDRALADGDRIRALIRGIGISSDGRGKSLWAPRKEGQMAAIERAYSADVTPDSVQMIEAHATSTHLGDATEMQALTSFYGECLSIDHKLPVGSVKSNIGHTLETAGIAGVVKAVLAIEHAQIPPTINIEKLSDAIPWSETPLYAIEQIEPWPKLAVGQPRRAAVNAFGIGGLNVHVVVDQYLPAAKTSAVVSGKQSSFEPIAIVGRGVVLPNAANITQFEKLINSASTRQHLQKYLTNFEYDWRKHKVPPKQIAHANPLQFMLLEAAEQGLREAGLLEHEFDRQHTAIVVGAAFGGDFGNDLFGGLRLPELKDELKKLLLENKFVDSKIESILEQFEARFLKSHPALLDETGSFTSSTLASRIAKTFNLMGGALAIDAGDVSSCAALNGACQLLQSGMAKVVLCAAAQRALDAAAVENLTQLGRLSSNSDFKIGEGVALVVLKRLQDAVRDGDQVLTIIEGIGTGYNVNSLSQSVQQAVERLSRISPIPKTLVGACGISHLDEAAAAGLASLGKPLAPSKNVAFTGHLQAAQGLVDLIAFSLNAQQSNSQWIASHTLSGQSYVVAASSAQAVSLRKELQSESESKLRIAQPTAPVSAYRLSATSLSQLTEKLQQLAGGAEATGIVDHKVSATQLWRASMVCRQDELRAKAAKLAGLIGNFKALPSCIDQGLLWSPPLDSNTPKPKVAWLFPGQGSQYVGMLSELVACDPVAAHALEVANQELAQLDEPAFAHLAWDSSNSLGEDVWQTQAAMLVADWVMMEVLRHRGVRMDLTSGHSFGEFAAMLAAGCWDFRSALRATWHRCRTISEHITPGCTMLSIQTAAAKVQSVIDELKLPLTISHHNTPTQTVVGGKQSQVAQLAQHLSEEEIVTRLLAVPTAFHTPILQGAVVTFRNHLESIELHPPRLPLLSSIKNVFVAEPSFIRDGLAEQLVTPLNFVGLVQRLVREGVTHVFEVGPQQILARLIRQTTNQLQVISTDSSRGEAVLHLQVATAFAELFGLLNTPTARGGQVANAQQGIIAGHFDATQRRRARLRKEATAKAPLDAKPRVSNPALHFDATAKRRTERREAAELHRYALPSHTVSSHTVSSHTVSSHTVSSQTVSSQTVSSQTIDLAPKASAPPPVSPAAQVSQVPSRTLPALPAIETFLIDFVVEQTGYPPEIIELDWDIEADLGIDSIKKAQLFGELREFFDLESHLGLKLDDYRTLRDIALLLQRTPGRGDWLDHDAQAIQSSSSTTQDNISVDKIPPQTENSSTKTSQFSRLQITEFLVDFVIEQTGYPPEIIELDADLEADLGIDSIKKMQLFGELREMFSLEALLPDSSRSNTSDVRTLRQILELLIRETGTKEELPPAHSVSKTSQNAQPTVALANQFAANQDTKLVSTVNNNTPAIIPTEKIDHERSFFNEAGGDVSVTYSCALHDNLRSMASRRHARQLPKLTNGLWSRFQSRCAVIAEACAVSVESQQALAKLLAFETRWMPIATKSTPGLQSKYCWFAAFEMPNWLSYRELATLAGKANECALTAVGGVTPLIICNSQQVAIAGFASEKSYQLDAVCKLSNHLERLSLGANLESQLRTFDLNDAWWLLVVDAKTQRLWRFEMQGTEKQGAKLESHSYSLSELSTSRELDASSIFLGFDFEKLQFVVAEPSGLGLAIKPLLPASAGSTAIKPNNITDRFILRMEKESLLTTDREPEFAGMALIVGDNPVAKKLQKRLASAGVQVQLCAGSDDPFALANQFSQLAAQRPIPHLFLLSPCDPEAAISLDEKAWAQRRNCSLMSSYWLCQKWLEHITQLGIADDASLIAVSTLGGDFGIGGHIYSAEGGGIGGLLKSMLIESWMQGYRSLPIKTIDVARGESPTKIVETIWRELAVPSYDMEIGLLKGQRHVLRAVSQPVNQHPPTKPSATKPSITKGGTWICSGGARGITAFVAEKLAQRYDLKLHLLGISPEPNIDPSWRELDESGLRQLQAQVMTLSRSNGKNPVKAWQDTEKALEIDATLRKLRAQGIDVHYHSCDVSDRSTVKALLEKIRETSGPIRGVLHGAGVGKDSRFDRKQLEKVNQCIAAKVDGALSLMEATQDDPLECFVGFGSISGRFGANGHTDYSLANDMLCKQIDWLKQQRPEVHAVGFHWHAWGDIGMATKPETRLALEMIDMQFMPAEEGFAHLVAELESSARDSEVLITDDRYYRMFYPAETLVAPSSATQTASKRIAPLLTEVSQAADTVRHYEATLDPSRDPFLTDHLLDSRPLLPFVIAAEMLLESARLHLQTDAVQLQNIEATSALRFFSDLPQTIRLETSAIESKGKNGPAKSPASVECRLLSDFVARDGRIVDTHRLNFKAIGVARKSVIRKSTHIELPEKISWSRVDYPPVDAKFYLGWSLRRLRKFASVEGGIVGRISAPALIELAGGGRDVSGWQVPSAALDACLYAVGILAWQQVSPGSALPVRMAKLSLGRLPKPGEACEVHARLKSSTPGRASFDFSLFGVDGAVIVDVVDYEVAWIASDTRSNESQTSVSIRSKRG